MAAAILEEVAADGLWDAAFAKRPDALKRLAEEAASEYKAGRTQPLDPDRL